MVDRVSGFRQDCPSAPEFTLWKEHIQTEIKSRKSGERGKKIMNCKIFVAIFSNFKKQNLNMEQLKELENRMMKLLTLRWRRMGRKCLEKEKWKKKTLEGQIITKKAKEKTNWQPTNIDCICANIHGEQSYLNTGAQTYQLTHFYAGCVKNYFVQLA